MKKLNLLFNALLILFSTICFSQSGPKRWYLPTYSIDMTLPTPQPNAISGATISASEISNGAYERLNPNGPPMFYIADGSVFDKNNTLMGSLSVVSQRTSEISIVPFPDNDNCSQNKYYIFYSSSNLSTGAADIRYQIVDMNANSGIGTLSSPPNTVLSVPQSEWAGIAVGLLRGGNKRNLYVVGGTAWASQSIYKVEIGSGGIFITTQLYSGTGNDFETNELDINRDETLLAFASNYNGGQFTTNRYYVFRIGSGTLSSFNVGTDNSPGIRGVEFYLKQGGDKLMVGAGTDGLFEIDPNNPANVQSAINGSQIYGHSQIEMGYNGYLYVGASNHIAAIDFSQQITVLS